uniref:separase n=1 Tax=Macrostomum lignano TaxID=282301 RepID=A0A1I8JF68_9PLAT
PAICSLRGLGLDFLDEWQSLMRLNSASMRTSDQPQAWWRRRYRLDESASELARSLRCRWLSSPAAKLLDLDSAGEAVLLLETAALSGTLRFSRMPSLSALVGSVAQVRSQLSLQRSYYVLNPDRSLPATEATFAPIFADLGWDGVASRPPEESELLAALKQRDLYVYCGHGSGSKYLSNQSVQQSSVRAAAFLIGCSSGRLHQEGRFEPIGTVHSYIMGGCPAVLAVLWDVTDKDIDRFFNRLLSVWRGVEDGGSELPKLINEARAACKLRCLIGAAPEARSSECEKLLLLEAAAVVAAAGSSELAGLSGSFRPSKDGSRPSRRNSGWSRSTEPRLRNSITPETLTRVGQRVEIAAQNQGSEAAPVLALNCLILAAKALARVCLTFGHRRQHHRQGDVVPDCDPVEDLARRFASELGAGRWRLRFLLTWLLLLGPAVLKPVVHGLGPRFRRKNTVISTPRQADNGGQLSADVLQNTLAPERPGQGPGRAVPVALGRGVLIAEDVVAHQGPPGRQIVRVSWNAQRVLNLHKWLLLLQLLLHTLLIASQVCSRGGSRGSSSRGCRLVRPSKGHLSPDAFVHGRLAEVQADGVAQQMVGRAAGPGDVRHRVRPVLQLGWQSALSCGRRYSRRRTLARDDLKSDDDLLTLDFGSDWLNVFRLLNSTSALRRFRTEGRSTALPLLPPSPSPTTVSAGADDATVVGSTFSTAEIDSIRRRRRRRRKPSASNACSGYLGLEKTMGSNSSRWQARLNGDVNSRSSTVTV